MEKTQNTQYELSEQDQILDEQREAAQSKQLELQPHILKLAEMDVKRRELVGLDDQLSRFEPDLDEQLEALEIRLRELRELEVILLWLRQFESARTTYTETTSHVQEALTRLGSLEEKLRDTKGKLGHLQQLVDEVQTALKQEQNRAIEAKTHLSEVYKHLERFNEVAHQPVCSYCGQTLTLQHLEIERARLLKEQDAAKAMFGEQESRILEAQGQVAIFEDQLRRAQEYYEVLEVEHHSIDKELFAAKGNQARAMQEALGAWGNLPPAYQQRISPDGVELKELATTLYPSTQELLELEEKFQKYAQTYQDYESLVAHRNERSAVYSKRELVEEGYSQLKKEYSTDEAQRLRTEYEHLISQVEQTKTKQNNIKQSLRESEQSIKDLRRALESSNNQLKQIEDNFNANQIRCAELKGHLQQRITTLSGDWTQLIEVFDEEHLAAWHHEMQLLVGSEEKWQQLVQAHQEQKVLVEQMEQLTRDLAELPVEAQKPFAELEAAEIETRTRHNSLDNECRETEREKRSLEERSQRRINIETARLAVVRKEVLYKELVKYLGRDYLQRYLLHQAEQQIVAHANEVLDRISNNTIRLELSADSGNDPLGSAKALDLLGYNSEVGAKPLPMWAFSGGQRFRIAVSLALAIGQYAGQGSRGIEAVIIDEGFGSLDQQGRSEMIDQLHDLQNVLKRIILVSHQQEFARAFSKRYHLVLEDNTSRAFLQDGDESLYDLGSLD